MLKPANYNLEAHLNCDFYHNFVLSYEIDGLTFEAGIGNTKREPVSAFVVSKDNANKRITLTLNSSAINSLSKGQFYYDLIQVSEVRTKLIEGKFTIGDTVTQIPD